MMTILLKIGFESYGLIGVYVAHRVSGCLLSKISVAKIGPLALACSHAL